MRTETAIENLLFSTVRIETITDDGKGVGTGFFVDYPIDTKNYRFLVTNTHVISNADKGRLLLTKSDVGGNLILGEPLLYEIDDFTDGWLAHKSLDFSILPFAPFQKHAEKAGKNIFLRSIPTTLIPSQKQLEELDALEEILFIGYPSAIYDQKNLFPIVRRGITATPIFSNYGGELQFLIDASVFHGSSGSPVFIYNRGMYSGRGGTVIGTRLFFCGILSKAFSRTIKGSVTPVEIPTLERQIITTKEMLDLGVVIRSSAIKELIESFLEEKKLPYK